jgi:cell shape-determining protein MreC
LKPKESDFIVQFEYTKTVEDQKKENEQRKKDIEEYEALLKKLSNIKNGLDAIKSNLYKSEV